MLKALFAKDEIEQQAKKGGSSLDKFEKIIKKEVLEQEKPINPKYIFNDYKKSKADKGKSYRKPKPETDGVKSKKIPVINIMDW